MPRIQVVHNTSAGLPNEIDGYIHCAKCLDERPEDISPKDWSRTQIGITADGLQVWCNRHNLNVNHLKFQLSDDEAEDEEEDSEPY